MHYFFPTDVEVLIKFQNLFVYFHIASFSSIDIVHSQLYFEVSVFRVKRHMFRKFITSVLRIVFLLVLFPGLICILDLRFT